MDADKFFQKKLLKWHLQNPRDMPWKKTRDPYKIWLSEIVLQQTRVEQGTPYYEKLIKLFPTVHDLANAHEDKLMNAWQGLGYYSRARNLHAAAKRIVQELKGKFPSSYEEILELKGVGTYTAAAIASFAFDLPHAVVDGNVFRVLARVFGVSLPIDSSEGKKYFNELAEKLLDGKNPAAYNQAIMNFGAMVCVPANPHCEECCFRKECKAFQEERISELPVKSKKAAVQVRWFSFLVMEDKGRFLIEKRNEKDIWKGLYQFPLIETPLFNNADQIMQLPVVKKVWGKDKMRVTGVSSIIKHQLSHQTIMAQFLKISFLHRNIKMKQGWQIVRENELEKFPFPKLITNYFESYLHL